MFSMFKIKKLKFLKFFNSKFILLWNGTSSQYLLIHWDMSDRLNYVTLWQNDFVF